MEWPNGDPISSVPVGYFYIMDREVSVHAYPDTPVLYQSITYFPSFLPFSSSRLSIVRPFPFTLVDLVDFLRFKYYLPDPPIRFNSMRSLGFYIFVSCFLYVGLFGLLSIVETRSGHFRISVRLCIASP